MHPSIKALFLYFIPKYTRKGQYRHTPPVKYPISYEKQGYGRGCIIHRIKYKLHTLFATHTRPCYFKKECFHITNLYVKWRTGVVYRINGSASIVRTSNSTTESKTNNSKAEKFRKKPVHPY